MIDNLNSILARLLDADLQAVKDALSCYCEDCVSSDTDAQRKVEQAFKNLSALAHAGLEAVGHDANILLHAPSEDETHGQELPEDFELNHEAKP